MIRDLDLLDSVSSELLDDLLTQFLPLLESGVFSARELLLLAYFIDPQSPGYDNATVAAQLAGFKGKRPSLSVQGSKTVSKAKKYGLFQIILRRYGCTFGFVAQRLKACATARRKQAFVINDRIVEHDLGDDYRVQLEASKFIAKLQGVAPTPTVLATQSEDEAKGTSGDHGNEIAVPDDLSPGELALQAETKNKDARTRMLTTQIMAVEQDVIRTKLKLAAEEPEVSSKNDEAAACNKNNEPEDATRDD